MLGRCQRGPVPSTDGRYCTLPQHLALSMIFRANSFPVDLGNDQTGAVKVGRERRCTLNPDSTDSGPYTVLTSEAMLSGSGGKCPSGVTQSLPASSQSASTGPIGLHCHSFKLLSSTVPEEEKESGFQLERACSNAELALRPT